MIENEIITDTLFAFEEDGTDFSSQWRLAAMELANWGTFCGYHRFEVSRKGMLLTGDSGSGKSTILDAMAAVMTPPRDLRLNAAASTEGKRKSSRTVLSYIRGAYGAHSAEDGEVRVSYLRDRIATWSGILLRFEQAVGSSEPINLVAIYFQKANSNDSNDTSVFYAVVKGNLCLKDLEEYGMSGADMAAFNKAFSRRGKAMRSHAGFSASFCSLLGIAGPETLTLLHKIQAAKDMGSLDRLFQNYMLEEPKTFDLANEAVEQFGELEQAYNRVVDQRRQMLALEPLPEMVEKFMAANEKEEHDRKLRDSVDRFREDAILRILEEQKRGLLEKRDALAQELNGAEQERDFAQNVYDRANEALTAQNGGSSLNSAELACNEAKEHLDDVEKSRVRLLGELNATQQSLPAGSASVIGIELPDTLVQFEQLKREMGAQAVKMQEWIASHAQEKVQRYGTLQKLQESSKALKDELYYLRSQTSNIPSKYHRIRMELAEHIGVNPSDLLFCGELIDVSDAEAKWQGAIERVLHSFAITLLVERSYAPCVTQYLEDRHLGLRFEYDILPVAAEIEVPKRTLKDVSLIRKLNIVDSKEHPAYSLWVQKCLREHFDYCCVDSPSDMAKYRKALTLGGQVKNDKHHVKDDRRHLNDVSNWRLGSSNDAKIADMAEKVRVLVEEDNVARAAIRDYEEDEKRAEAIIRLSERLRDEQWQKYDLKSAQERLESAQAFFDTLRNDPALSDLEKRKTDARERLAAANGNCNDCAGRLRSVEGEIEKVDKEIAEKQRQINTSEEQRIDEASLSALENLFMETDREYRTSVGRVYGVSAKVNESLRKSIESSQAIQQNARRQAEKAMQHYKENWPSESADLSTDFVDAQAYVKRYKRIKASGLPEYEGKFLAVLNEFSQDRITAIASEIRNAYREIRDKLEPVNRSLLLSEFSSGISLRIEVQEHKGPRVKGFLADLKQITSESWDADDTAKAYERYDRTARIMKKLASNDYASRTWRQQCLDTRTHVRFIAQEMDAGRNIVNVHSNDGGLSGGERQKLVLFCLAAALRYQLSDENASVPTYGTIVLDEAFDKSDRTFAKDTLLVFERFGFHMVLVTPNKLIQLLEDHIGSIGLVNRTPDQRSHIRVISFEENAGEDNVESDTKRSNPNIKDAE